MSNFEFVALLILSKALLRLRNLVFAGCYFSLVYFIYFCFEES